MEEMLLKFPKALEPVAPQTNIDACHFSKNEIISLKYKMVDDQLDRLISWAGRRFLFRVRQFRHKFSYQDIEDVRQDIKLVLWGICNQYWNKPERELLKIGKTVIWRWVAYHVRMAKLKKNRGVMIMLSDFQNPTDVLDNLALKSPSRRMDNEWIDQSDATLVKQKFYEHLISHNYDATEVQIFKLVAFPDQEPAFEAYCDKADATKKRHKRNMVNQTNIANYLGMNHCNVHDCLRHLKKVYKKFQRETNILGRAV